MRRYRGLMLAALIVLAPGVLAAELKPTPLPPLSMERGTPRLPGKFVWADLVTDDLAAARAFYSRLFGWTYWDLGTYVVVGNEERPMAGMFQRTRPTNRADARPRWFGYISVPDVKKAEKVVLRAGGRVLMPARALEVRGEQELFMDAEGAIFGVVRSSDGDPADFLADPGDFIWVQLYSRDAVRASRFYADLAGYEVVKNEQTNRLSDYVLTSKGYARATVRAIPPDKLAVPPNWLFFVRVASVKESVAKAVELGGRVLIEAKAENLQGRVAVIADPTGAALGLMEWDAAQVKGAP